MSEMQNLYQTNKDLQDYIDRYRRNKDVTVEEVLFYKQTQLVAEHYREEEQSKQ